MNLLSHMLKKELAILDRKDSMVKRIFRILNTKAFSMAFPVKIYGSLVLNGEELSTTIIADVYPHYCRMLAEKVNSPATKTIKTTAEFWNATILFEIADKLREIDLTAEAPDVRVAKEVFLAEYEGRMPKRAF